MTDSIAIITHDKQIADTLAIVIHHRLAHSKRVITCSPEQIGLLNQETITLLCIEANVTPGKLLEHQKLSHWLWLGTPSPNIEQPKHCTILEKPFHIQNFASELQLLLNEENKTEKILLPGEYELTPSLRLLSKKTLKNPLHLTEKETALLLCLHRHSSEGCNRQTLLKEVWGYKIETETNTLETHISRLRNKLQTANIELKIHFEKGAYFL